MRRTSRTQEHDRREAQLRQLAARLRDLRVSDARIDAIIEEIQTT
ncbi:hypothetical protein ABIA33_000768 [Streptacidiphilus sp. MAP12-16]